MKLLTLACLAALLPAQVPWTMQRLPDTGQTRRYATAPGDDSQVTINPPRFATPSAAVATDLVTGLQWQRTDGGEMKWETAITYCQSLTLDGLSGWRLPFAQELFSIHHLGVSQPPLDTAVFSRTNAEYWWAIEPRADAANLAWATNAGGGAGAHPVSETLSAGGSKRFHARCVRHTAVGNPTAAAFTDHGDGTITDNRTGLMWQKDENPPQTWEEALAFAYALRLANYDDWRVPNSKELRSLHSDYRVRPSIDSAFFPGAAQAPYWSSTTQIGQNGITAWTLDFTLGVLSYHPKTDRLRLRAVRGGAGPRIAFGGIRNAASFAGGPVAEGEIISIFGTELASGKQVFVNGAAATIVAWLEGQINAVVPPSVRGQPAATIAIDSNPAHLLPTASAAPALFSANSSGSGPAAAWNEDNTRNTATAPARRGSILVLYATGHGALRDGAEPALPVEVRLDGQLCEILYAGLVPGLPAGVLQLNVRVPAQAAPGAVAVELRLGEHRSPAGVTVHLL